MLKADFRRMFKSKRFYILLASALVIPILITVMMTMMSGTVSVDPQTGVETVMQGPENSWQAIGTLPSDDNSQNLFASTSSTTDMSGMGAMGGMDVMSMCNINMVFMLVAVFICLFISDDFRSGYAKNLFTVRAKKGDYVFSKTIAGFICGALMLILYFIGAMIGGGVSGLSFDMGSLTIANIVMCMLSKILLMLVFIPIFVLISVGAKKKAWLSLCGSLGGGMLLFMMVPMITPLDSTIMNAGMCLAGGVLFSISLGAVSKQVLKKTSLV